LAKRISRQQCAIIGDHPVQFSDTGIDDHVKEVRDHLVWVEPMSGMGLRQCEMGDRGVGFRSGTQKAVHLGIAFAFIANAVPHEIGATNDSDDAPAASDRKAFDVTAFHRLDHRFKCFILADRLWIDCHNLFDLPARTVRVFLCELAGPDNEFEPFRPLPLRAQFATAQKIAFGDDADQLTILIGDGQAADAIL
jgi:hypothetical protein